MAENEDYPELIPAWDPASENYADPIAEKSWQIAFETFPDKPDAFKAGELAARIQTRLASLAPAPDREGGTTYLTGEDAKAFRKAMNEPAPIEAIQSVRNGIALAKELEANGHITIAIKGDDTLSIRAREMLAEQLEADGFEDAAGYVLDEQGVKVWAISAIRAIERALSTGEAS